MSSTSSGGASVITLQFSLELTLDVAEQEVQAAINAASNFLPADLPAPPVYSKVNPADAPILTHGISSKRSEERRVGKECSSRRAQQREKKKMDSCWSCCSTPTLRPAPNFCITRLYTLLV